jgi:hypothetical protein
VSYGEILTALPFLNTLAVKSLTGHELRDTIFHGLSGVHEAEGRFLQARGVSGVCFVFGGGVGRFAASRPAASRRARR